ncbi:hypothetical protein B0H13DRAFT_1853731 [Mycena leptocephala]|nr:hypothetical protein B0H13DRAFT_1853731 [Mycena leptocephala]
MSDSPVPVATHPVALRLVGGKEKTPHVGPDLVAYGATHAETVGAGSDGWWAACVLPPSKAPEMLHWDRPFKTVRWIWIQLRWLRRTAQVAIIYAGEECSITYSELLREVCSLANILTSTFGVKKGDTRRFCGLHRRAASTTVRPASSSRATRERGGKVIATVPFFGHVPAILDPISGEELHGNGVEGVLALSGDIYEAVYEALSEAGGFLAVFVFLSCVDRSVPRAPAGRLCTGGIRALRGTGYPTRRTLVPDSSSPAPRTSHPTPTPPHNHRPSPPLPRGIEGDDAARSEDGYIWIKRRIDGEENVLHEALGTTTTRRADAHPPSPLLHLTRPYPPDNYELTSLLFFFADVVNVSGHRLSTAKIESALIMHMGVAQTAGSDRDGDELTGQVVYAFVTLKLQSTYDTNEAALTMELVLQMRKVIAPFAALKKIYIVPDLLKTWSGKIMCCIMHKIVAGEGDQLGNLSTVEPAHSDRQIIPCRVGIPRTKEKIVAELEKQVKLACAGVVKPVKYSQTQTGDIKKGEPDRADTDIQEELVQWTLDNRDKIYSAFLTMKGFDPTKDTAGNLAYNTSRGHQRDLKVAVTNVLDALALIDPSKIITKVKLHLLAHIDEDTVDFEPLVGAATEIFESFNAILRYCSILSNHLALSRDIAVQLGDQEGLKHLSTDWTRAGPGVRHFMEAHPVLQKPLGWSEDKLLRHGETKLEPFKRGQKQQSSYPLGTTTAASALNYGIESLDQCFVGSWVFAQSFADEASMITGRVSDILIENSLTVIIVLELFQVLSVRDEHYGMPVLVRRDGEKILTIIPAEKLKFKFNAQHDCRTAKCEATGERIRMQERVESDNTENISRFARPDSTFRGPESKHDEFASTLRDTRADKRAKKKAASETTTKKGRGRKRKTAPEPEPDREDEDNTGAARSSQPMSRKRARTTVPAEPREELDGEGLVDNLVAGRVKRVAQKHWQLRGSVRAARKKMV